MWQVEIQWLGEWYPVGRAYGSRDNAEWHIAMWRQQHGGNGRDTGFRVARADDEYVTLDSVLGRGRHEGDSGCDLGNMPK